MATIDPTCHTLVNSGYLGHMWELYTMWAWIGSFLQWDLLDYGRNNTNVVSLTFIVIAIGAVGSIAAGFLADKFGRTRITIVAMMVSGTCALTIGILPPLGEGILIAVALVWGISVIADSAQFSAATTELSEPQLVGTMLTIQTSLGCGTCQSPTSSPVDDAEETQSTCRAMH